ncbi:MAG TPA: hypothetical protein VH092_17330 [Urbifossiella sp.]|jgi:hypothetical protein|nr:hypothetical protein [Urbifossiella sp.]
MTDDAVMRHELQRVAAYRELCAGVRRGGRHNAVFAGLMLALAGFVAENGGGPQMYLYTLLALAELLIGLYKWLAPSAEGVLLDGGVFLLFAGWNFASQALGLGAGRQAQSWGIFLGLFLLWGAVGRFRAYGQLRRMFADRPTRDQLVWFDDLAAEIRRSDPDTDPSALDLPTRPRWKAKLLGSTAFLVAARGESAVVAGPWDIDLSPAARPGRRGPRVVLRIYGREFPAFEIDPASYENYRNWAESVRA